MAIVEQKKLRSLPDSSIETTLSIAGNKWVILILRDLMSGTMRFSEIQRSIGTISQKALTTQLRSMEENGLVTRKAYAEVPPRVEYTLTDLGYSLRPVLDAMDAWGTRYKQHLLGH